MAYVKTYETFYWTNQTIDEKLVSSVRLRIFKPRETVPVERDMQLISTDGKRFNTSPKSIKTFVHNYSYVLLSTGIREKIYTYKKAYILVIKLYITEHFDISALENKEFIEKTYVLEALRNFKGFEDKYSFSSCLAEKVEPSKVAFIHSCFSSYAATHNFDKVEQLFKKYNISQKGQAIFWKEMYMATAKKQK